MSDRMSVVGTDGKVKYILDESGNVYDMKDLCACVHPSPSQDDNLSGVPNLCIKCNKIIKDKVE